MRGFVAVFLPLLLIPAGCAVVGVKVDNGTPAELRREAIEAVERNGDSLASASLTRAQQEGLSETDRASALVEAARLTACATNGTTEQAVNKAAVRALIAIMEARGFEPLQLRSGKTLGVSADSKMTIDPRTATGIIPADDVKISKLRTRVVQDGAGLPCVVHFAPGSIALAGQAGIPPLAGICEPATAVLRAGRGHPELVFCRTRVGDVAVIEGSQTGLAADFSAPLAYLLSRGQNRSMDIAALLRSDKHLSRTGLYQFDRYDPEKIPVVFVHGLMSRPETWVPAVNGLMADRQIRERYQFWFFLYPTGLPVWASAAELRSELDRYRQTLDPARSNRNVDRMVLAGHSMGGLVSSLQVRSGGEKLWRQFMDTPPHELSLSEELKNRIIRIVQFQPRPEVSRVVFFATPHRGSDLAVNPVSDFFSRLIKLPFGFLEKDRVALQSAPREDMRDLFVAPANSITFLRANSPLLKAILALPMRRDVACHSVIGDRGRGDTPDSSDGVVPYWSSHLESARSERIVPSGHGAHESPEGIAEFARILRAHL